MSAGRRYTVGSTVWGPSVRFSDLMSILTEPESVSVCVCTRRRLGSLSTLLTQLARVERPRGGLQIVVVENDDRATAAAVLNAARSACPDVRFDYAVEARRSISLARNLAVSLATGEWVAFIDDDECPVDRWIVDLLATAQRHEACGAFGPVVPVYPTGLPRWLRDIGVYERPRFPSGTVLPASELRTGNALISRASLLQFTGPFDPQFGATGGEDAALFSLMAERGCRFVWSDTACVSEVIEPRRLTFRGLAQRAFAGGQTYARIRWSRLGATGRFGVLLRGLGGALVGAIVGVALLPLRRSTGARWMLRAIGGIGKLCVLSPVHYRRYR